MMSWLTRITRRSPWGRFALGVSLTGVVFSAVGGAGVWIHESFAQEGAVKSSSASVSQKSKKPLTSRHKANEKSENPIPVKKTPEGFRMAVPGYQFEFPADQASHPEYKTEWWYYTGHFKAKSLEHPEEEKSYGFELTFFRIANPKSDLPKLSGRAAQWDASQMYMSHFALTDVDGQRFMHSEKLNRKAYGRAGAKTGAYHVWNENWSAKRLPDGRHELHAALRDQGENYTLDLVLTPSKPPVIHGHDGVSQKSSCEGCASHYYSIPRLALEGTLSQSNPKGKAAQSLQSTQRVTGIAWMDQEFGSNQLAENQTGWDWFSIQLSNGMDLMLYQLRRRSKDPNKQNPMDEWEHPTLDASSSGTLIYPDGRSEHLNLSDFSVTATSSWTSPQSRGRYPMSWDIRIPKHQVRLNVIPKLKNQELFLPFQQGLTYWEGACTVEGRYGEQILGGTSYVEMTGYAQAFESKI